jgi:hypothetical protein
MGFSEPHRLSIQNIALTGHGVFSSPISPDYFARFAAIAYQLMDEHYRL